MRGDTTKFNKKFEEELAEKDKLDEGHRECDSCDDKPTCRAREAFVVAHGELPMGCFEAGSPSSSCRVCCGGDHVPAFCREGHMLKEIYSGACESCDGCEGADADDIEAAVEDLGGAIIDLEDQVDLLDDSVISLQAVAENLDKIAGHLERTSEGLYETAKLMAMAAMVNAEAAQAMSSRRKAAPGAYATALGEMLKKHEVGPGATRGGESGGGSGYVPIQGGF